MHNAFSPHYTIFFSHFSFLFFLYCIIALTSYWRLVSLLILKPNIRWGGKEEEEEREEEEKKKKVILNMTTTKERERRGR